MKIQNLRDLFHHMLQDTFAAETLIAGALPAFTAAARSGDLVWVLNGYLAQTRERVSRLEQIFVLVERTPAAAASPAIEGVLRQCHDLIAATDDPDARDAAVIAAAQTMQHFIQARYGALVSWANRFGQAQAAKLLAQSLSDERKPQQQMTHLAEDRFGKIPGKEVTMGERLTAIFDRKK